MEDCIIWWKGLSHNWKKTLLANYDFNKLGIERKIYTRDIYNSYFKVFNKGIRQRLNEFDISKESIQELVEIESAFISHEEIKDIKPIKLFRRIKNLKINGTDLKNLESLSSFTEIEEIVLQDCGKISSLKGIEYLPNLKRLTLISCYQLFDLSYIIQNKNIEELDLEHLGHVVDITLFASVNAIKIGSHQIYGEDFKYDEKASYPILVHLSKITDVKNHLTMQSELRFNNLQWVEKEKLQNYSYEENRYSRITLTKRGLKNPFDMMVKRDDNYSKSYFRNFNFFNAFKI